jgi:hypothetical protein
MRDGVVVDPENAVTDISWFGSLVPGTRSQFYGSGDARNEEGEEQDLTFDGAFYGAEGGPPQEAGGVFTARAANFFDISGGFVVGLSDEPDQLLDLPTGVPVDPGPTDFGSMTEPQALQGVAVRLRAFQDGLQSLSMEGRLREGPTVRLDPGATASPDDDSYEFYLPSANFTDTLIEARFPLDGGAQGGRVGAGNLPMEYDPQNPQTNPRFVSSSLYEYERPLSSDVLLTFTFRKDAQSDPFKHARLVQWVSFTPEYADGVFQVFGFTTDVDDVPDFGVASYQGAGYGFFNSGQGGEIYDFAGLVSLSVNFGEGPPEGGAWLTGEMTDFLFSDGEILIDPSDPLQRIFFSAAVGAAGFNGEALAEFLNGDPISGDLRGLFFGPSDDAPEEIGGVFGGEDGARFIYGGFVAGLE